MTDLEAQALRRENDYLKTRCAQLQDDVTDVSAQLHLARQQLERTHARRAEARPGALGGGQ